MQSWGGGYGNNNTEPIQNFNFTDSGLDFLNSSVNQPLATACAIGSIFGLYGSLWTIYQFKLGRILNNFPGLIIAWTAFVDILIVVVFLLWSFTALLSSSVDDFYAQILDIFKTYCLSTVTVFGLFLAWNALYVLTTKKSKVYEKYRIFAIPLAFILPILIVFLPISWTTGKPVFITYCNLREGIQCYQSLKRAAFSQTISTISIVGTNLMIYISIMFILKSRLSNTTAINGSTQPESQVRNEKKTLVLKLITVYSLAISLSWIFYFVFQFSFITSKPEDVLQPYSFTQIMLPIAAFFICLRGYIQAVAVYYVHIFVTISNQGSKMILFNFLLMLPKEPPKPAETFVEPSVSNPKWEVSFQDGVSFPVSLASTSVPRMNDDPHSTSRYNYKKETTQELDYSSNYYLQELSKDIYKQNSSEMIMNEYSLDSLENSGYNNQQNYLVHQVHPAFKGTQDLENSSSSK